MYDRIRELRTAHGYTQNEVAARLNVSQTTYSRYETGTLDIPSISLIALGDVYNVSVDYILGRTSIKKLRK